MTKGQVICIIEAMKVRSRLRCAAPQLKSMCQQCVLLLDAAGKGSRSMQHYNLSTLLFLSPCALDAADERARVSAGRVWLRARHVKVLICCRAACRAPCSVELMLPLPLLLLSAGPRCRAPL